MEGNGGAFPYYYHHGLLHLGPGQVDPPAAFGEAGEPSAMFPSPSSSAGGDGAGNPPLFPQSAVAAAAGGRASPLAPAPAAVEPVRRKRGRPRKYGVPPSSSPPPPSSSSAAASFSAPSSAFGVNKVSSSPSIPLASSPPPRVARARKKGQHESVGKGGQSFAPYLIAVAAGEDVVQQIMTFVQQQQSRAVCIISASGTISSVTLRQPAMSGGHVTYEGNFEIVSLNGSFLLTKPGVSHSRTGGLSVCFSDERCTLGGGVSGPLVAAGPVQVIAGSFSIASDENPAASPTMEKNTVSNLSTPFPEPEVSPSVVVWSTADSTGRISTNSITDDHRRSTGGTGGSFMLQPRGVHVLPSQSLTDLGVRQDSGHLGAAYRSPEEREDEHMHR